MHALRAAILIFWLVITAAIVSVTAFDLPLPAELQGYVDQQEELPATSVDFTILAALLLNLIFSMGLFFAGRWARIPYAITSLYLIVVILQSGPNVDHAIPYMLDQLMVFVAGFIVALSFYGAFEPESQKRQTT
jgi:hypothetical protein